MEWLQATDIRRCLSGINSGPLMSGGFGLEGFQAAAFLGLLFLFAFWLLWLGGFWFLRLLWHLGCLVSVASWAVWFLCGFVALVVPLVFWPLRLCWLFGFVTKWKSTANSNHQL